MDTHGLSTPVGAVGMCVRMGRMPVVECIRYMCLKVVHLIVLLSCNKGDVPE